MTCVRCFKYTWSLLLVSVVAVAEPPRERPKEPPPEEKAQPDQPERRQLRDIPLEGSDGQSAEMLWKRVPARCQAATKLNGMRVLSRATTDRIGEINETIVDPDVGRVLFYIVEFDRATGLGNQLYAIPPQVMRLNADAGSFEMAAGPSQISQSIGFARTEWPNLAERGFYGPVFKAFHATPPWDRNAAGSRTGGIDETAGDAGHQSGDEPGDSDPEASSTGDSANHPGAREASPATPGNPSRPREFTAEPRRWQKASDLCGKPVVSAENEEFGTLKELVIDPDSTRVLYGVATHGGVLGVGDTLVPIPWGAIQLSDDYKSLRTNVSSDRLRTTPLVTGDGYKVMTNASWAERIHRHFDQPCYWTNRQAGDDQ